MNKVAIRVENLSKIYRLGEVGTGTISHDLNRWWARVRGKEDPYGEVGQVNDRTQKGQNGQYVYALKDINFEVQQGEVLGIIGKNGAGKSTLLKLLSKITAPSTGRIKTRGRIASLLEVGTGMHPEMTGIENVYLNGTILGMTRREIKSKLNDILDFAGCAKYGDTPVKRYSSGMKVRLGFAVAAFLEPEVLIVDEVLAVGDAEFQKRAIGKMQDISRGGERTVLFVSHNMVSIENLCNKSLLLQNGEQLDFGKTASIISKYLELNFNYGLKFSLNHITNRSGNGVIKLINFHCENIYKDIVNTIKSGDEITFVLSYQCYSIEEAKRLDFGISIHREDDTMLTVLYSSYQGVYFNAKEDKGIVRIKIPSLNLANGSYLIGARVLCNGNEADYPKDKIGSFFIEGGDYFGTGSIGYGSRAPVLFKALWAQDYFVENTILEAK